MNNSEYSTTMRKIPGPTPAGGSYAILYFFDENDEPVIEEEATKAYGVEFDEDGHRIKETYFNLTVKSPTEIDAESSHIEDVHDFPRIR